MTGTTGAARRKQRDGNQTEFKYSSGELSRLINSIRLAAKVVNHEVNKAGLVDILGAAGETNVQGEDQQKLDVYANDVFIKTLINMLAPPTTCRPKTSS